jgi:hypothetical protein
MDIIRSPSGSDEPRPETTRGLRDPSLSGVQAVVYNRMVVSTQ